MKITENTTVNLTVLGAFLGGVLWLTAIHSIASKAADDILDLKTERSELRKDIAEMKQALARIEGKLEK
jgi:hypothetical protein